MNQATAQHPLEHQWAELELRRLSETRKWPELSIPGPVSRGLCSLSALGVWADVHSPLRNQIIVIRLLSQKCCSCPAVKNHLWDVISQSLRALPASWRASHSLWRVGIALLTFVFNALVNEVRVAETFGDRTSLSGSPFAPHVTHCCPKETGQSGSLCLHSWREDI